MEEENEFGKYYIYILAKVLVIRTRDKKEKAEKKKFAFFRELYLASNSCVLSVDFKSGKMRSIKLFRLMSPDQ